MIKALGDTLTAAPCPHTFLGPIIEVVRSDLVAPGAPAPPAPSPTADCILTITSCKRLDLFQATLRSVLRTWSTRDLQRIRQWVCVDDNSSDEDRVAMTTEFPFVTFILKGPDTRGHLPSMNMLYDVLTSQDPTYWVHLEDDWLFFWARDYLGPAIDVLEREAGTGLHQVLFNRHYAETLQDWQLTGGAPILTSPGFVRHVHGSVGSAGYWPHFSFRPSVIRWRVVAALGPFSDDGDAHFERQYAKRWTHAGFTSAFYDAITCLHIGKLTSEKGANAYSLNGVLQFPPRAFCVNLDKRPDRWASVQIEIGKLPASIRPMRFAAVDGADVLPTLHTRGLFAGNDFGSARGVIGCALSHMELWCAAAKDPSALPYFIIEDDANITHPALIESALSCVSARCDVDVVFLGYSRFDGAKHETSSSEGPLVALDRDAFMGGTFGYVLTHTGAKKLISFIGTRGIQHGIDYVMKKVPDLALWTLPVHAITSECVCMGGDTDIQCDRGVVPHVGPSIVDTGLAVGFPMPRTAFTAWECLYCMVGRTDAPPGAAGVLLRDVWKMGGPSGPPIAAQTWWHSQEHEYTDAALVDLYRMLLSVGDIKIHVCPPFAPVCMTRWALLQTLWTEWEFHEGVDAIGNDFEVHPRASIPDLLMLTLKLGPSCVAFNTLGFFKHTVSLPLRSSAFYSPGDGVFIRRARRAWQHSTLQ